MKSHDLDSIVKKSLEARTIAPSKSAWSRLSNELDQVDVSNRKTLYRYVGYAASIILMVSLATIIYSNSTDKVVYENDLVKTPVIDAKELLQPNMEDILSQEKVVVKTEVPLLRTDVAFSNNKALKAFKVNKKVSTALLKTRNNSVALLKSQQPNVNETSASSIKIDGNALLLAVTQEIKKGAHPVKKSISKKITKNRMQINSDALLYAVTHPAADMKTYYKKYRIDRDDVLQHIQKELTKKKLAVDASLLLASVEKTIDEETFKNRFMQVVAGKITALAIAFSNRNNEIGTVLKKNKR